MYNSVSRIIVVSKMKIFVTSLAIKTFENFEVKEGPSLNYYWYYLKYLEMTRQRRSKQIKPASIG